MRYLGLILTAFLFSASSMFAGSQELAVPASGTVYSNAIPVFTGDTLYTAGRAVSSATMAAGVDVNLQWAARAAGPWADGPAGVLAFSDASAPFDESLEDAARALTGELYLRYEVVNATPTDLTLTLYWDVGGEKTKAGIGGSRTRLYKPSVGASSPLTIDGGGAATSAAVYAKGYDYVTVFFGAGTGATGTLTLERGATRDGPWFTTGVSSAWAVDTEEFLADAVADGAHYYRAVLSAGTADDVVAVKLHPR